MKRIFNFILVATALCIINACSNGDYSVNPSSNSNSSVNPLDPLKASDFTWSGTDPISANIDGAQWVASNYSFSFDSGKNSITGFNGTSVFALYLTNTWAGNVYNMGYGQFNSSALFADSLGGSSNNYYESVLGNSGGLYIIENDSVRMKGLFYFQGVNGAGQIINITNGYFNISKI